jgi:hypothetical protein
MIEHILSQPPPFKHQALYNFWLRSNGLWHSKLVKVVIKLLTTPELTSITELHHLEAPEFGIRMSWEYNSKDGSGQMLWAVDANYSDTIFTTQGIPSDQQPSIYHYQLLSNDILLTIAGKAEETNILESSNDRRLRELRYDGKLIRRHWESKFGD